MQQEELILIDSGAACHVCPRDWATSSSDADDTGLKFRTASGATMKHFGRRCVGLQMKNVQGTGMAQFEVTEVRRPILSAGRLVDSGHALILDSQNPHLRRPMGEQVPLETRGGFPYLRAVVVAAKTVPRVQWIAPVDATEGEPMWQHRCRRQTRRT